MSSPAGAAYCAQDALAAAARLRPDAYLLDIGMPDLSGYDLARRIRHEAWGRNAYLIALTGWARRTTRKRLAPPDSMSI